VELEHTEVLGNTCTKIARDKAGIIRPAGYLITGDEKTAVLKVLRAACKEVGAGFIQVKSNRKAAGSGTLQPAHTFCQSSPWPAYQYQNLRVVDAALRLLGRLGYPVSVRARREGIKKTYWPARFEILSRKPRIIIDGAHNPAGVAALIAALRQYPYPRPAVLIFGAIKGKQVAKMLPPLTQHFDAVFLTGFKYATALSPREILAQCKTVKIAKMFSSPRLALAAARKSKFKTVLICGSLYMLGELTSRLPV
jgi:dihydrofolate synthase/folylpolyglutamate synthase